ncbi:ATP-binding protein [Arenibacter sp. M-2]|uniref:ATP-binding protein n=1 Tax=Arenibacter sp. M-2 TaxID=3053612 RepID=UPI000C09FFED|nr:MULTISPECIES: ATP-binding protein [Flavobacteriaceae]MAU14469.1 AAA family ATPase [Allomuricauda sp.]MDL5511089.1 ATP-binding protein [Arenibacter sp. M-2]|tara:strand:- start:7351 stop:8235 length:885 start_codon:yes stop_codon:yes gene_type:complete
MAAIFDNTIELPNKEVQAQTESLIGFENKFKRIYNNLKLLLDQDSLTEWSKKHHKTELPIIKQLKEKYPLIILAGDAGTGKTISAVSIADKMTRELKKEGFFLKLSTRVRGEGLHGEMGKLVNDAFSELKSQAGKRRFAFLLIDEADAIATTRGTNQMHQEEKAAVNTLIQKIDEIRELNGRAIIFMSTNRLHFIDEAILRRAAVILEFERPTLEECKELYAQSLYGMSFTEKELDELALMSATNGESGLGYSFSDIRLKVLPEAIANAYPNQPLSFSILKETIKSIKPSPAIK